MLDTNYTEIILNLKDVCIKKVVSNSTTITIFLEQKRKPHNCPICGTITNTIHDYRQQTIKDIPMFFKAVFYILRANSRSATSIAHIQSPNYHLLLVLTSLKEMPGGHKFQCILTDAANKKVLDILPSRKTEDLYEYFTSFSIEERSKVKYVVMDLSPLFSSVVRQCFPNAKIVADKFHIVRLVNWAIESIR